jgi:acetylornithine deacetylase/succinyl-diaminopimelate desuccinylase-like protein
MRCTLALEGVREPFETPASHPLVQALRWASRRVSGREPEEVGLALVGDANLYVRELGVPTVYYGPGYETAHSDEERVSIGRVTHAAQVYVLAALAYCGV